MLPERYSFLCFNLHFCAITSFHILLSSLFLLSPPPPPHPNAVNGALKSKNFTNLFLILCMWCSSQVTREVLIFVFQPSFLCSNILSTPPPPIPPPPTPLPLPPAPLPTCMSTLLPISADAILELPVSCVRQFILTPTLLMLSSCSVWGRSTGLWNRGEI